MAETLELETQLQALEEMLNANMGKKSGISERSLIGFQQAIGERAKHFARFGMADPAGQALAQQAQMAQQMFGRDERRNELQVQLTKAIFDSRLAKLQFEETQALQKAQLDKLRAEEKRATAKEEREEKRLDKEIEEADARIANHTAGAALTSIQTASLGVDFWHKIKDRPQKIKEMALAIEEREASIQERKSADAANEEHITKLKEETELLRQQRKIYDDTVKIGTLNNLSESDAQVLAMTRINKARNGIFTTDEQMAKEAESLNTTGMMIDDIHSLKLDTLGLLEGVDTSKGLPPNYTSAVMMLGNRNIDISDMPGFGPQNEETGLKQFPTVSGMLPDLNLKGLAQKAAMSMFAPDSEEPIFSEPEMPDPVKSIDDDLTRRNMGLRR